MDFKSLLQSMDNISENTVHKAGPGGYGNKHGTQAVTDQYGKKIGKVSLASLGPKDDTPAKRGRPVDPDKPKTGKDDPKNKKVGDPFGRTTGDVPKGKKGTKVSKMNDADKKEKKSLKDWIENLDKALNEADQYTTAPMPGAVAIKDATGKVIATAKNPQAADAFKKGDISLSGDEPLSELSRNTLKAKEQGMAEGNGDPQITPGMKTQYGTVVSVEGNTVTVKASNGELTTVNIHDIEQGMAKDKRSTVAEGVLTDSTGSTMDHIKDTFRRDIKDFTQTGDMSMHLMMALHDYYYDDMPYAARSGDPYEWLSNRFADDLGLDEGSRQDFTTHGMDSKPSDMISAPANPAPTPWKVDPIQATTDRAMDMGTRAGSFIKSLVMPKKTYESNDMKDIQVENWEKELNTLLTEGFTVTSTTGQQGQPDSVSINATDTDAQELLAIVRKAGLGVFGGDENTATSAYGAPVRQADGTGTQPEASPEIVGDDGDMMALIKKMSGIQSSGPTTDEPAAPAGTLSPDYEEEEHSEQEHGEEVTENTGPTEQDRQDHYHDLKASGTDPDEAEEEAYGTDDWFTGEDEDKVTEGNPFVEKVLKAKSDNIPDKGQTFTFNNKKYPVKEEDEKQDQEAQASATCESCGMSESKCSCDTEAVEESFANSAEDQEMADFKMMLNMGNDLHRVKRDQTVGNPTKVTMETKLMNGSTNLLAEWQKLSGIK